MIAEIKFKNILSFRDEAVFSFEADRSTELESYHVVEVAPDVRLLKLGVIYGANASGKSNFVRAYNYIKELLTKVQQTKSDKIEVKPFLLDDNSRVEDSEFSITFYAPLNGAKFTKFVYTLSLYENCIESESLAYYTSQQPTSIFSRSTEDGISKITFGNKIKIANIAKEEISIKCLPNMSVFAAYMQVNTKIAELECATNYFSKQEVQTSEVITLYGWIGVDSIKESSKRDYVLKYLKAADFNISNIGYDDKDNVTFQHKTKDADGKDHTYDLPVECESRGTIRTLDIAKYVQDAVANNSFIAIDEIESSLHPKLVEHIIETFLQESTHAQLLVTTHYDGLLAQDDLLRKDNIWFTEKGDDGASVLYPLTDFKALNRISSLQKAYKFGKFGAIPNI
ncbi:MAG: ATP-binding protein [Rikenellaceae bacterium]